MEALEKKEYLNRLFELYGKLLTEKQSQSFQYYYVEDYSLHEISELLNVSRNAIFDQLKKVENHLLEYESKLQLYAKETAREKLLNALEKNNDKALIKALRKLDE